MFHVKLFYIPISANLSGNLSVCNALVFFASFDSQECFVDNILRILNPPLLKSILPNMTIPERI